MFNNGNSGYSLADIAAATGNDGNNGFGFGGNGAWWIFAFFILFLAGGWGNGYGGWGGNGNGGGTPQLASSMNTDYLSTGLRDLTGSVANDFYTLNTGLLNGFCDVQNAIATNGAGITSAITNGFNTQNLANLQNTNAVQKDIYDNTVGGMQNTQLLQSTLAQMASDNRADTAALNYNLATQFCAVNNNNCNNTRDIIDSQNAGTRAILDAIQNNKVEAMQDKINSLTAQNTSLQFQASQQAQNAYLVEQLGPKAPIPAFNVPTPFYYGCFGNALV